MRSSHADEFNHDAEAEGYDADVLNESDPIRAGYGNVLDWVIRSANLSKKSRVLELGSGTGNLTQRIPDCKELVCVDLSERMEEIASSKVGHFQNRRFIKQDALAFLDEDIGRFDAVVSAYTIHHLTEDEKGLLFKRLGSVLDEEGVAVFGDLMLRNAEMRDKKIEAYRRQGNHEVVDAIEEEFFWHLEESIGQLEQLGFRVDWERFSDLSFGISARLGCSA